MSNTRIHRLLAALVLLAVWHPAAAPAQSAPEPAAGAPDSRVIRGEDIVRVAKRYLGVPYRLGGETPKAFDCSGLVQYVFGELGIPLPRTAHEQAGYGDAPEPGDLRPGDLLFFFGGRGAQHVAIYAGNETIIHASSGGHRVKLDRFDGSRSDESWFGRRLIAVRRIIPAGGVVARLARPDAAVEGDEENGEIVGLPDTAGRHLH